MQKKAYSVIPTFDDMEAVMSCNWSWNYGAPYCKGFSFEESKKYFETEKRKALGIFRSRFIQREKNDGDDEKAIEIWRLCIPLLNTVRLDTHPGPLPKLLNIYRECSRKVQPQEIGKVMPKVLRDLKVQGNLIGQ